MLLTSGHLLLLLSATAVLSLWSRLRLFDLIPLWVLLFGGTLAAGWWLKAITPVGLMAVGGLFLLAGLVRVARRGAVRTLLVAGLLLLSLLLLGHLLPGFVRLVVIEPQLLKAGSVSYEKLFSLDKVAVVFALLGIYAPRRGWVGWRSITRGWWVVLVTIALVMALGIALGRVRLSFGFVALLPLIWWAISNLLVTCAAEEGLFRGLLQRELVKGLRRRRFGTAMAVVVAALLFGLVHFAGGWDYVVLAMLAGLGYGTVYQLTGRIEAAITSHFLLNTIHLLLFSYPALA